MAVDREALARRIFLAHLELERRLGNRVGFDELGALVAEREGRKDPYSEGNVRRWEKATKLPSMDALGALAELAGLSKLWLVYGEGPMAMGVMGPVPGAEAAPVATPAAGELPVAPAVPLTPSGPRESAAPLRAGRGAGHAPHAREPRGAKAPAKGSARGTAKKGGPSRPGGTHRAR